MSTGILFFLVRESKIYQVAVSKCTVFKHSSLTERRSWVWVPRGDGGLFVLAQVLWKGVSLWMLALLVTHSGHMPPVLLSFSSFTQQEAPLWSCWRFHPVKWSISMLLLLGQALGLCKAPETIVDVRAPLNKWSWKTPWASFHSNRVFTYWANTIIWFEVINSITTSSPCICIDSSEELRHKFKTYFFQ